MTSVKKIIIVSAVIHPTNTPRANRASELAIELARLGYDVTLYAVLGKYDYREFEEEHRLKVKNIGPMKFFYLNSDADSNANASIFSKLLSKLLTRIIEFPQIELAFKVSNILHKIDKTDLLITIAHPFPIHWGAAYYKIKNKANFPNTWVADCGDPFMGNKFRKYPFYFKYVEKWFCKKADYITIPIENARDAYYPEFSNKIRIIPQGFKFNDNNADHKEINNKVPTFLYAGAIYKGVRDPSRLLDYLMSLNLVFKFIVYTRNTNVLLPYKKSLGQQLELRNYIPRIDLIEEMKNSDFLINIENGNLQHSPSKLIDYALSNRPILSINSSMTKDDRINLDAFLGKNYTNKLIIENIGQYNISNVAQQFIKLIKQN